MLLCLIAAKWFEHQHNRPDEPYAVILQKDDHMQMRLVLGMPSIHTLKPAKKQGSNVALYAYMQPSTASLGCNCADLNHNQGVPTLLCRAAAACYTKMPPPKHERFYPQDIFAHAA